MHVAQNPAPKARCTVLDKDRRQYNLENFAEISDILATTDDFMWFDLIDPSPEDLSLLQEEFGLHPLAIEDAVKAHQRSKIEPYGDYWFIVLHGATEVDDEIVFHEIAVFAGKRFMITVRDLPAFPFEELERRWAAQRDDLQAPGATLLYQLIDTITDGYAPIAEGFIGRVDRFEATLFNGEQSTDEILLEIFDLQKQLGRCRRAITPIRDILQPIMRGAVHVFTSEEIPYYRDIHDHIMRVVEQLDEARDLVNNARDVHVSISSSRQNQISRQLTIVATVFLPLTFITGFFGQNFGWLTEHITSESSFAWLGVGSEITAFIALLFWFRTKRWL